MIPHHKNKSLENITAEINGVFYVEQWADVEEFKGIYEVSSFGRIRKKRRKRKWKDSFLEQRIMCCVVNKRGYVKIVFRHNSKSVNRYVHRLVGIAFITKIEGKPEINHKTGVKTDNHFSQLEWCTTQENTAHAVLMGLAKRGCKPYVYINKYVKKGRTEGWKKIINTQTGEIYANAKELSNIIGWKPKEIRRRLNGEYRNTTIFRYA
jgi:hypothetical protein